MSKRKKLIVGNWKMNPATLAEAKGIFGKIKKATSGMRRIQTVICPPSLYLSELAKSTLRGNVSLGVQDIFWEETGSFTGQISSTQVRNVGAHYTLVGHSEKRALGDSTEQVSKKLEAALRAGLTVILCVGEAQRDREGNFYEELKNQILFSLGRIRSEAFRKSLVLAYEPVWEIGRTDGKGMKPSDVHETSIFIRRIINDAFGTEAGQSVPILYGGSVDVENARAIVYEGDSDGLLIGRQSLDAEAFKEILSQIEHGDE